MAVSPCPFGGVSLEVARAHLVIASRRLRHAVRCGSLVVGSHRCADPVLERPGRLVADLDRRRKPVGREAVLGLDEQRDGDEPFPERHGRVVEIGHRRHAEAVAAFPAVELVPARHRRRESRVAARAADALRPAKPLEVGPGPVVAQLGIVDCEELPPAPDRALRTGDEHDRGRGASHTRNYVDSPSPVHSLRSSVPAAILEGMVTGTRATLSGPTGLLALALLLPR